MTDTNPLLLRESAMTPFDACVWFWLQLWFGAWR